jgi:NitT/TauT family transport system ATP-binding protein
LAGGYSVSIDGTKNNQFKDDVKIKIMNLSKYYLADNDKKLTIFSNLNVNIKNGEFVCIIGPSGCGKTTFLSIVAGLTPQSEGKVLIDNKVIIGPGKERGVVFQQDAILPWRTVIQNIEYGLELNNVEPKERRNIALKWLRAVNLSESFSNFYPKQLSGGMKKRVAVAMVFANNPDVLLMDEPFGALDYATKVSLQAEVLKIWEKEQKTTLFVTHDIEEALYLGDRILVLANGRLEKDIEVGFKRPRTDDLRMEMSFQELKKQLWQYLKPQCSIE